MNVLLMHTGMLNIGMASMRQYFHSHFLFPLPLLSKTQLSEYFEVSE